MASSTSPAKSIHVSLLYLNRYIEPLAYYFWLFAIGQGQADNLDCLGGQHQNYGGFECTVQGFVIPCPPTPRKG